MQKSYSLALWWWAARSIAQVWVIKYIEEKKIDIVEVSGTSMWAVVAAFLAIWKTSYEMNEFVKSTNFLKLIDFDLKKWLLKWKKIIKRLEIVFWNMKIEDTKIKLKIVARNLDTWDKKVFEKWNIIDAIRASISLPWIFISHKIWENRYIDWGMLNNLPIEILDWKDIIAISTLKKINTPLRIKKKILWFSFNSCFLNINCNIFKRDVSLMIRQNEDNSINTLWKKVLIIYPEYKWLNFYNFNKVKDMILSGYSEAKIIIK